VSRNGRELQALLAALACVGAGCSIKTNDGEVGIYSASEDAGSEAGAGDAGSAGASDFLPITLDMLIRDFKRYNAADPSTNPDFHNSNIVSERSVVAAALGSDGRPVYRAPTNSVQTFGKTYFDQWYRDVVGTNIDVHYPISLSATADGDYQYDSRISGTRDTSSGVARVLFMPIDDGTPYATAFGNQSNVHNLGFTGEMHALFTYQGQGSLQFRSDDDLYVFIDHNLVVDLGGDHGAEAVDLDVGGLGLIAGNDYPFDLFYAERAGAVGEFLIGTSLALRPVAPP
jgi:fibro-slime domain-containing protein